METAALATADGDGGGPGMSMVRTSRNNNVVHHLLPTGFESCTHNHVCPACTSTLILKVLNDEEKSNKNHGGYYASTALDGEEDLRPQDRGNITSSLEYAHSANLLLQALSFDAATREERQGLDTAQLAKGIPYCPECKVHVITSTEELERLFDEYDSQTEQGSEGEGSSMEWLRGSLLVTVDNAEVMALQSRKGPSLFTSPSHSEVPSTTAHTINLPRHLQPKPTKPIEFDYDYRHKVATHAMASRITKGYTLLEEICPECEMPLMKSSQQKSTAECVVCPKLYKKIERYHGTATPHTAGKYEESVDPISAIIAEARNEAPHQANRARRVVQPDVAEAKQFVMQRQIMNAASPRSRRKKGGSGETIGDNGTSEAESHGTESLTDCASAEDNHGDGVMHNPINWEELLVNGRTILSKRLNEGWTLSSTNCCGSNCKGTPLLQRLDGEHVNLDYCVVCGGSGNGEDGAYERELEWQARAAEEAERLEREAQPDWEELVGNGRALLAERLKQGWTMSSENCLGYHCNDMPLTNIEGGPNSCVVCGGSGNGCDGAYENYKPNEVVEEERALVSQELSRLLSMGWVLRETLCVQCLMPLVAEEEDAEEDLCILCGRLPENNPYGDYGEGDDVDDSYMDETYYETETLREAVIAPVATFGDDNTIDAGKRLMMGWTLPDTGLCHHCGGVQMSPPNSNEVGCIQRGCPSALASAYTLLPQPHESTGPVKLVGRGFGNANNEEEEGAVEDSQVAGDMLEHQIDEEDEYLEEDENYDGPPLEVGHKGSHHDEPSVLSDDLTQVRSVASSALGIILVRLDDAKYELQEMRDSGNADAQDCARKQVEIAQLIERLASAAVQMRRVEGDG